MAAADGYADSAGGSSAVAGGPGECPAWTGVADLDPGGVGGVADGMAVVDSALVPGGDDYIDSGGAACITDGGSEYSVAGASVGEGALCVA